MARPRSLSASSRSADRGSPGQVDFRLVDRAKEIFKEAFPVACLPPTWRHGNRTFAIDDYLGFMLLALYVPTCDSLRGLCKASELDEFARRYGCFAMDLSSVSKAQADVPEELLLPVIARLADEARQQARPSGPEPGRFGNHVLRVVDSTVFAALPQMAWALFGAGKARKDGKKSASVRFHVSFDPIALSPAACAVTSAAVDEKAMWADLRARDPVQGREDAAKVEVGDRNFGSNYKLLDELSAGGTNFVVRVKEAVRSEGLEELELAEEEKAAGIRRHAWVRLGGAKKNRAGHRVRLIWLERPDKVIVLATNLPVEDAAAVMVAEMYRNRWEIEFFFWWLKRILKVGHWFARSEKGVRIQLYLVMILALLLQLRTGARPTKRMIELLHFHVQGMASEKELLEGLKERAREADLARESARRRYLAKKQAGGK